MSLTTHTTERRTMRLSQIVFDETIYPRKEHDPALAQRYSECLDEIEAAGKFLCVTEDGKLLDGKHRWLGYRIHHGDKDPEIPVVVHQAKDAHHQLATAVELNSQHGWQLTADDKRRCAIALYNHGFTHETIAAKLSVSKTTVNGWLSRTIKEERDRTNEKILAMWLACHSQEEIGEATGMPRTTIEERIKDLTVQYREYQSVKLEFSDWVSEGQVPIYNVWKQQDRSNKVSHFGNTEERWLENLLYLYTQPFDVVIDPFAGGGSTIDVCKRRGRRYYVSDRKPIVAREGEIRKHDITDGLPPLHRWKDARLVYLDPPYWRQAQGQYSDDPTDLANMDLERFNESLSGLIKAFAAKLKNGGEPRYIALVIQPTQWSAPDREYTDHVGDMLRLVKLPVEMRVSAPYESQQCNAQMVEWAKQNRRVLVLTREVVVWRVGA